MQLLKKRTTKRSNPDPIVVIPIVILVGSLLWSAFFKKPAKKGPSKKPTKKPDDGPPDEPKPDDPTKVPKDDPGEPPPSVTVAPFPAQNVAAEEMIATATWAEQTTSWETNDGVMRTQGSKSHTSWLTDVSYWKSYPEGPVKFPSNWESQPAFVPYVQAWLRLNQYIQSLVNTLGDAPKGDYIGSGWTDWPFKNRFADIDAIGQSMGILVYPSWQSWSPLSDASMAQAKAFQKDSNRVRAWIKAKGAAGAPVPPYLYQDGLLGYNDITALEMALVMQEFVDGGWPEVVQTAKMSSANVPQAIPFPAANVTDEKVWVDQVFGEWRGEDIEDDVAKLNMGTTTFNKLTSGLTDVAFIFNYPSWADGPGFPDNWQISPGWVKWADAWNRMNKQMVDLVSQELSAYGI